MLFKLSRAVSTTVVCSVLESHKLVLFQISGTVRANLFMTKIKYTQNKRGEVHASYKPYFQGNPSRAIFRSLLFSEYQEGLELANHLTLILLTWAVQAALHISSCATKTST